MPAVTRERLRPSAAAPDFVKQFVRRSPLLELRDRLDRRSLDRLGVAAGLRQSSAGSDTLRRIEAAIGSRPVQRLAIITAEHPALVGSVFARRYPAAQVHVLDTGSYRRAARPRRRVTVHRTGTLSEMHDLLRTMPPVDVLIDCTDSRSTKTACLRHLLFHVQEGGLYVVDRLDSLLDEAKDEPRGLDVWQALSRILRVKIQERVVERETLPAEDLGRADAIGSATHDGSVILVQKTGRHVLKLHDAEAEEVLAGRRGPSWGRRLTSHEPLTITPASRPHANALEDTFRTQFDVPRLYLREYRDVVCAPRQLVVQGNTVLPISFHHAMRARLLSQSPLLHDASTHFATLDESMSAAAKLPGVYYHLDSEFPGHFGHFMTEDVAKLWGWELARAEYPDAKLLVSTPELGGEPTTVQRTLLAAWGVAAEDIVCIDRPVHVDLLVGATQMYYNGIYVHPELHAVWDRLREALRPPPAERPTRSRRIFVSRAGHPLRVCRNATQVEDVFTEHGFQIVRPELLSIPEQVSIFEQAEVIAGFGGSGMFSAIYNTSPGRRIVISSDQYLARNEWAIAAAKGDDYHHFFCEAELRFADAPVRIMGFHSPFTFDFDRDGPALQALLTD